MIKIIFKIILFHFFYYFDSPKIKPLNLVISLTDRCNSKCKTCNIWRKKNKEQLSLNELNKIFISIGRGPYEVVLTGGEPFLREDIVKICQDIVKHIKSKVIIIPTNGILFELIPQKVKEILDSLPRTKIVINLSVDGIGDLHDEIRGVLGNFEKALKTFEALKSIKNKNLDLKVHSVISRFNVKKIPEIYQYVRDELGVPYITEVAEQRVELETIDSDIIPIAEDYSRTIDFLISEIKKQKFSGLDKITQAFRIEYYKLVKKILLNKKRAIPCYAGIASAQITPDGEVWACCIRAESMGNLRKEDYDFKKIWRSRNAKEIRKSIKKRKCFCPLANASYTNMLLSFRYLSKVIAMMIK